MNFALVISSEKSRRSGLMEGAKDTNQSSDAVRYDHARSCALQKWITLCEEKISTYIEKAEVLGRGISDTHAPTYFRPQGEFVINCRVLD